LIGADRANRTWLEIVLTEGKNRQVRRMCAQVGHDVVALTRVRIGGLGISDLEPGRWRRLTAAETAQLVGERDTIRGSTDR
jgi:23S rRNA pseudouridine2605 synthase